VRQSDVDHVAELVEKAEAERLSRSEVVALLIMLRGMAPRGSVLRDIGDGVAHDVRDKGMAFEMLRLFTRDFIRAAMRGGVFDSHVLYPVEDLISDIASVARRLDVPVTEQVLLVNSRSLALVVAEALDGTEVSVGQMASARLEGGPAPHWVVTPKFDVDGDKLRLYRNIGIAGPLLFEADRPTLPAA